MRVMAVEPAFFAVPAMTPVEEFRVRTAGIVPEEAHRVTA
jgi:hypothetical protein